MDPQHFPGDDADELGVGLVDDDVVLDPDPAGAPVLLQPLNNKESQQKTLDKLTYFVRYFLLLLWSLFAKFTLNSVKEAICTVAKTKVKK